MPINAIDPEDAALDKFVGSIGTSARQAPVQQRGPMNDDEALDAFISKIAPQQNPNVNVQQPKMPAAPQHAAIQAQDTNDYANMPWSEVASSAASHFAPSAREKFSALGNAVMNPSETLSALGQVGTGLYSKAKGAFVEQDPDEKAKAEAVVDALGHHYAETYGSMAGFKKALATDPTSIGMDVASLVPGVGAAGRAVGLTTDAAGAAGKLATLGSIAGKGASMLDPIQAAITAGSKIAGTAGKVADWGLTGTQAGLSGVPKSLLSVAREAGATKDIENATAFKKFQLGQGDPAEIADTAMSGLDEMKQNATNSYLSNKENLAKSQVQLPMDKVIEKLNDLNEFMGPASEGRFSGVRNVVDDINNQVYSTLRSQNPNARTMINLDNLKQSINQHIRGLPAPFNGKVSEITKAIRDTVADHDSTYAKMMDDWGNWKDTLNEYQKDLRLKPNSTTTAMLGKMLKEARTNDNMPLISGLASTQAAKTLPYMLAGHATSPLLAQGLRAQFEYPAAALTAAVNPSLWPHIAGAAAASSPRLGGISQYAIGKAQKALEPVGTAAEYAASIPATYGATRLGEIENQQASGGRIGRKSGGRIGNVAKAEAERLINLADRIKKSQSGDTKPLLNLDDTTVAKALAIANKGI